MSSNISAPKIVDYGHYKDDGVMAHEYRLPKNTVLPTHAHSYSHMSILARGKVILSCEGTHTQYDAMDFPQVIQIAANKEHTILAIEPSTWFCIHAIDVALREDDMKSLKIAGA